MEKRPLFIENEIFHVYNRGNGHEPIFQNFGNYDYFLKKYHEYMTPYWETLVYCLMPNHFHVLVRVKPQAAMEPSSVQPCVKAYADFCNGYVQSYNKQHGRRGSLFMRNFKRKMVADDTYFRKLVCYIHNNPVKDGMVPAAQHWYHSSFHEFFKMGEHQWPNNEIVKRFGSKDDFLQAHIAELSPGSIDIKSDTVMQPPRVEFLYDRMRSDYADDQQNWEVQRDAG